MKWITAEYRPLVNKRKENRIYCAFIEVELFFIFINPSTDKLLENSKVSVDGNLSPKKNNFDVQQVNNQNKYCNYIF